MKQILYLLLAVLLLICLSRMPYGYYVLVRYLSMIAFIYLAYDSFKTNKTDLGIVFVVLAILFQPIFKIALGRVLWNVVDVVVAIGMIYLAVKDFNKG